MRPGRSTPRAGFLSAAKKLLDATEPEFQAVTAIRGRIEQAWKSESVPFPEPGVRLIRRDRVEAFSRRLEGFKVELADAAVELDRQFDRLRREARRRLGSLYDPDDYPGRWRGRSPWAATSPRSRRPGASWRSRPASTSGSRRVTARFEEAVRLAEEAFTAEFARLVSHLRERLTGTNDDGSPKVFRDGAVGDLKEFFERSRRLDVRSNDRLDALVAESRRIVRGVEPDALRDGAALRGRAPRPRGVGAVAGAGGAGRPDGRPAPAPDRARRGGAGGVVMPLVVAPAGRVRCLYGELIELAALGDLRIARAGRVEPCADGRWHADLRPLRGPVLGPFARRSEALDAERARVEARRPPPPR